MKKETPPHRQYANITWKTETRTNKMILNYKLYPENNLYEISFSSDYQGNSVYLRIFEENYVLSQEDSFLMSRMKKGTEVWKLLDIEITIHGQKGIFIWDSQKGKMIFRINSMDEDRKNFIRSERDATPEEEENLKKLIKRTLWMN